MARKPSFVYAELLFPGGWDLTEPIGLQSGSPGRAVARPRGASGQAASSAKAKKSRIVTMGSPLGSFTPSDGSHPPSAFR